ncbi:hypothetical protein L596_014642 [Steinernema carpocapsae]|uniref:Uncharacterized protein n=1 Tax=Steinernema carpocapsae TaxID=34508 RepID=A0A4U5NCH8_STECR|nr:hypothetical protein L596_014642 [Steinernema carpocapsae]
MVQQGFYKAVIFDMGGVILRYKDIGKFVEMIDSVEKFPVLTRTMERMDVGELTLEDAPTIAKECIAKEPETQPIFDLLKPKTLTDHLVPCSLFASAVKNIRTAGMQTALLTNNFFVNADRSKSTILPNADEMFDVVVESCRTGLRKPNPEIYELTLQKLGLEAKECVFVDDLLKNCEAAEKLGMKAVQVKDGNAREAVDDLGKLLGIPLFE